MPLSITPLRGLAWFWAGLLIAGTAGAGTMQWLGAPPAAPDPVAPPEVLEQMAIAHATETPEPPLPALRPPARRLALVMPVPPLPPAVHRRASPPRRYAQVIPPPLRPPAPPPAAYPGPYYPPPYAMPDPRTYAYYPGYGYGGWRY